ncbi:NFACT family protein, partial [Paenibacillus sepulcri]|nr:NFACT family protein [Paenibacillus sepulcri]
MALDGIVTRAIVNDLQSCIGSRIHKIHQPTDHDLVFQIKGRGSNSKLLLSANPTYPRVHWTEQSFLNPTQAPMFCMLLRKHCESGLIEDVRQIDNERIIHIDIRQRDELGDISLKTIIIEIMGRHSNIILIDAATRIIHDGIHHVTPAISSFRIVMPGAVYAAPPEQDKRDPITVTTESGYASII